MSSYRWCFSRKSLCLLIYFAIIIFVSKLQVTIGVNEKSGDQKSLLGKYLIAQLQDLKKLKLNNVSRECSMQFGMVNDALNVLDASAKMPSGILYGHHMEMGNFEECLDIKTPLTAQYCQVNIPFEMSAIDVGDQLQIGICVPNKCDSNDLDVLVREAIQNLYNISLNATNNFPISSTCTTSEPIELGKLDWFTIGLSISLGALMVISTLYGYICILKMNPPNRLLNSFSINKNMQQLLKIQHGHIPCLHGIRCFSLIWIIFIHCYLYQILSPNINAVDIKRWQYTSFSMIEQSGNIAVDTFLFLSGMLIIMGAFREMDKNIGKFNIPLMYVHRYLRLTPTLAVAVLFYMTLFNYIDNGPMWKSLTSANKLCDDSWWATVLYVQNYATANKMCLGHTWYLAVDTQLFLISPIFIILIWKWRKLGVAATIVFGLLLVACLFTTIMLNQYTIYDIARNYGTSSKAMPKIYYATHIRCSPWIVGLIFGYYMHQNNGNLAKIPKWLVAMGWFISLVTLNSLVFGWYPRNLPNNNDPSVLESAFYLAVGRVAWPLALCWIVYACMNGYGGIVNTLLSWTFWQPISKLSYSMYIWHLIIITINAARVKTNTYFSDYDVILNYWSNFGITLIVSLCVYLAIEAPVGDIESYLLPRHKPKADKQFNSNTAIPISQENLCE